jgi:hypothetical protein
MPVFLFWRFYTLVVPASTFLCRTRALPVSAHEMVRKNLIDGEPLATCASDQSRVQPQLRTQLVTCPLKHLAQGREIVLHDGFKPVRV